MATYKVVQGDTLYAIAAKYGVSVSDLVSWNNITNPNYIVVGQVINVSATTPSSSSNLSSRAVVDVFGLQSNTNRTIYATWTWNNTNTEHYQVIWYYDTGDGVWFIGSDTTVANNQATYGAPENAKSVKFKVKPVAKKYKVKDTEVAYWTASWSTEHTYDFSNNPPATPPTPSVSINKYLLETEATGLNKLNASVIHFQVIKDNLTVFKTSNTTIQTDLDYARYTCYVDAGSDYKVRCRTSRGNLYSEWSGYSSVVSTIPATPSGFTSIRAASETSVYLSWEAVTSAKTYDIEYATKKEYFDTADATTVVNGIEYTQYEKTGLESGEEYFFRVRAVNSAGESGWSEPSSIVVGKDPIAPTTWASSTTVVSGEDLTLYWVHNSEDGSSQTFAELELYVNGTKNVYTIQNSTDEDEKDKTSFYVVDTSEYVEGTKLQWRVRTAGITKVYGDWSIERTVDIYASPTLTLVVNDITGNTFDTLETLPITIVAVGGPQTQTPTGYHLSVTANEAHETTDSVGNVKMVNKGDSVYSKYFDIDGTLEVTLSAGDLSLDNNISYTITCVVSMNSGLTAEASHTFKAAWSDDIYEPNVEIGIDSDTLAAYIKPHCWDKDVLLSVYRREFDGSFTELATGIENGSNTFVSDPHPSLDYARYRVVAIAKNTGAVSYYDAPGYYVGEKSVVIQWDEAWTNFDVTEEGTTEEPAWSGSMLKLPYNIDISDNHNSDVSLVKYIGRKRPVTYYGTQLGETATWNVDIPKNDKDTLYALRRLAIWMGDVYVREPSGSGYWANLSVSFSQTHRETVIPVTLDITRVEGGI